MPGFPYTTTAPPPTAGSLPIIQQANESTPVGGGGGSSPSTIGPNPVVSSITTNGDAAASGYDIVASGLEFSVYGSTLTGYTLGGAQLAGGAALQIEADTTNSVDFQFLISTGTAYAPIVSNDATSLLIRSDGSSVNGVIAIGTQPDGTSFLASYAFSGSSTPSTLNVYADGVNISSLVCSTINGVAPGAAVIPADLAVSTLSMGAPGGIVGISSLAGLNSNIPIIGTLTAPEIKGVSSINGAPVGGGVGPELGTSSITCSSITMTDGALYGISSINDGTPQLLLVAGDVGITGGYLAATAVSTNTITPLTGAKITLNTATIDTTAGNLVVSSINGAAYPPAGGGGLQYSTISNPVPNIINVDPGTTTSILAFSTIAGHVYSASVNARANITSVPVSTSDMLQTEILDNNVGNDFLGSWLCSAISTSSASGGFYQQVGGTINWKAGGSGASFSVYTLTSTQIYMDSLKVIDFGAI